MTQIEAARKMGTEELVEFRRNGKYIIGVVIACSGEFFTVEEKRNGLGTVWRRIHCFELSSKQERRP